MVPNIVSVALLTGYLDLNFWVKAVSILLLSFTVCHFTQVKFAAGSIRPCLSQDQKCPEMNMHLDVDLNLDAFWYFDGLGYYNFCLPIFGSDLVIVFCTSSQRSVQIGDCRFWY